MFNKNKYGENKVKRKNNNKKFLNNIINILLMNVVYPYIYERLIKKIEKKFLMIIKNIVHH